MFDNYRNFVQLYFKTIKHRFWLYFGGTYLVGYVIGALNGGQLVNLSFFLYFLYFLFPANLFLYGINDFFDYPVDVHNEKKRSREHLLRIGERKDLMFLIMSSIVCSLLLLLSQYTLEEKVILFLFLLLIYFYNARPLRFKSRPVFDFLANGFYVLPGLLAFYQASGRLPSWIPLLGFYVWACAMYLFASIPKIEADKAGHIRTTAVLLGKNRTLVLCSILWLIFAIMMVTYGVYLPWSLAAFLYPIIPFILLFTPSVDIRHVYWKFPWINSIMGFFLFLLALIFK